MRVDFVLLCTSAEYLADGRMVIVGAGIDGVSGASIPLPVQLCLVARLYLMPDESPGDHTFRVEATKPDGNRVVISPDDLFRTARDELHPERPAGCNLFVHLQIVFEYEGDYRLHLLIDDEEVKSMPLFVSRTENEGGENVSD